jgi:hypothetical protein
MSLSRIEEAAKLLAGNPLAADEDLVGMLKNMGWDALAADLAVSLLPIAFGRFMLMKLGARFPDQFQAKSSNGEWIVYRLSDNDVFRAAARLAAAVSVHGTLSQEELKAIADRSPEVGALSKALDAGFSLTELPSASFAPPCLLGATAENLASEAWSRWFDQEA